MNSVISEVREFANKAAKFLDVDGGFNGYYNDKLVGGRRSVKFTKWLTAEQARYVADAVTAQFGFKTNIVQIHYLGRKLQHFNLRFYC